MMVCASSLGGEGDDQKKTGRREEERKSGRTAVETAPLGQVMMFLFLAFFFHLNFPFQ